MARIVSDAKLRRFFDDIPDDLKALGWHRYRLVAMPHFEPTRDGAPGLKVMYRRPKPSTTKALNEADYYASADSRDGNLHSIRDAAIAWMRRASVDD